MWALVWAWVWVWVNTFVSKLCSVVSSLLRTFPQKILDRLPLRDQNLGFSATGVISERDSTAAIWYQSFSVFLASWPHRERRRSPHPLLARPGLGLVSVAGNSHFGLFRHLHKGGIPLISARASVGFGPSSYLRRHTIVARDYPKPNVEDTDPYREVHPLPACL